MVKLLEQTSTEIVYNPRWGGGGGGGARRELLREVTTAQHFPFVSTCVRRNVWAS